MLTTENWHYLYSKPTAQGRLKARLEDFYVQEKLGYQPIGEGEHIYLWLRKTGLNTAYVAEQLAKFCAVPLRAVTYAGRKDKYAVTEQWFGIHLPGKKDFDWSQFKLEGVEVITSKRHNKKLRTGVLKGNHFKLVLRNISQQTEVEEKLQQIAVSGVPNYFGSQRFGNNNSNLHLAQLMLNGEEIRNRNKRSMAISALRSWLFNQFISERLQSGHFQQLLTGDVMQLTGSQSYFVFDGKDPKVEMRLQQRDIQLTCPMWGQGQLASQEQALTWEQSVAITSPQVTQTLEALGLKQERRAICLTPENLSWQFIDDTLHLGFDLPSGCFATSVVRELIQVLPESE